ncbi:MAG: hypothetical protein GY856_13460 [bacterium]|nr:hypothetical protein [bacterium]
METLRIPRREARVRVHLQDLRDLEGVLYFPSVRPDGGQAQLIDRLNEEAEGFIPLTEDEKTHLIHVATIVTVSAERGSREVVAEHLPGHRVLVRVHLVSGETLSGRVSFRMPEDHDRLLDFLNEKERFFPMQVEDQLTFVNRGQVVSVTPLRGE